MNQTGWHNQLKQLEYFSYKICVQLNGLRLVQMAKTTLCKQ